MKCSFLVNKSGCSRPVLWKYLCSIVEEKMVNYRSINHFSPSGDIRKKWFSPDLLTHRNSLLIWCFSRIFLIHLFFLLYTNLKLVDFNLYLVFAYIFWYKIVENKVAFMICMCLLWQFNLLSKHNCLPWPHLRCLL